jgi:hypothetical protein
MNRDLWALLKDCIVAAVSDDYETFETIVTDVARLPKRKPFEISQTQVAEALRNAIAEGLVDAYVLSPTPPHSTRVEYTDEQLHNLWYYVTARGKAAAKAATNSKNGR